MAITTDVGVCNLALAKIGHPAISSLSANTPEAIKCNVLYEPQRDALLELFPWRFAIRRANFDVDDYTYAISAATQANPVVITSAAHSLSAGHSFYVWDVSGMTDLNNNIYIAGSGSSTTTLQLYKQDRVHTVNGSAYSAYTSGGYVRPCPVSEYDYMFNLPSDCLRVFKLHPDTHDFKEEDGFILTNYDEFEAEYIYQNTDVTKYSSLFVDALAAKIAAELTGSLETTMKKEVLLAEFELIKKEAMRADAQTQNVRQYGHRYSPKKDYGWQKAGK